MFELHILLIIRELSDLNWYWFIKMSSSIQRYESIRIQAYCEWVARWYLLKIKYLPEIVQYNQRFILICAKINVLSNINLMRMKIKNPVQAIHAINRKIEFTHIMPGQSHLIIKRKETDSWNGSSREWSLFNQVTSEVQWWLWRWLIWWWRRLS